MYNNENFTNSVFFVKVGSKFCQILNKAFKNYKIILKIYQRGEILPHLVTQHISIHWSTCWRGWVQYICPKSYSKVE